MADRDRPFPIPAAVATLVVAAATVLVFLPSLSNDFVDWDDQMGIVDNERIRTIDGESIGWMFSTYHDGNWIPLNWLSHALVYSVAGLDPAAHHLANLLFHCANAVLFFFLAVRILARAGTGRGAGVILPAAFAALFWAIHPLRVESVAWVTERKDLGNALFFLVAILAYLRYCDAGKRRFAWYGISLASFVLSLLFKSMTVTLPVVLLLLDAWPLGRLKGRWIAALAEKIPFLVLSILFGVLAIVAQASISGVVATVESLPVDFRVMNALRAILFYLQKTLLPLELAPLYPIRDPAVSTFTAMTIGAALLVAAATGGFLALARRGRPALLVAWLYFLVTLAPVLGLLQVGRQAAADRYTYIPSLCLGLLIAAGFCVIRDRVVIGAFSRKCADYDPVANDAKRRGLLVDLPALAWLVLLGTLCAGQIGVWKDALTLWEHQTRLYPDESNTAYCNLAVARMAAGDADGCIAAYETAMRLGERYPLSHCNLGHALLEKNRLDRAAASFRRAIVLDEDCVPAHRGLWLTHFRGGNDIAALDAIRGAIRTDPDDANLRRNLGRTLLRLNDLDAADAAFAEAEARAPGDAALLAGIASAFMNHDRLDNAGRYAKRALELAPHDAGVRRTAGLVAIRTGDTTGAVEHFRAVAKLEPGDASAFLLLGEACERAGSDGDALAACRKAVEIDPGFGPAHHALARLYHRAGRLDAARLHMTEAVSLGARVDSKLRRELLGR